MTSPYPELKALSDEERKTLIQESCEELDNLVDVLRCCFANTEEALMELCMDAQYELDRIKQLVLTRGKDEES